MAIVAWTTYENSAGMKPRVTLLFQPKEEGTLHTEDELRLALAATEKELRTAWLLPGKGQTLESMKPQTEESRRVQTLKKELALQKQDHEKLQKSFKELSDTLKVRKLALEDAEHEATTAKRVAQAQEIAQKNTAEQLAEVRGRLTQVNSELQRTTQELESTRKQAESARAESEALKSQLDVYHTPQRAVSGPFPMTAGVEEAKKSAQEAEKSAQEAEKSAQDAEKSAQEAQKPRGYSVVEPPKLETRTQTPPSTLRPSDNTRKP